MGYLTPCIIARWAVSNFGFKFTEFGKKITANSEELNKHFPVSDRNMVFVIMSFSEDNLLIDVYNSAIKPTVKNFGFECVRVDEIEYNRRITDKVIECIRHAKIIIADLTEQRPNCCYELGYAHALGKEVIHTIKESRL